MKRLLLALFMVLCFASCTVITYDYTGPRPHRVYVQPDIQLHWSYYTPYGSTYWWSPWYWHGIYNYCYTPYYYGGGHYSTETPYIPRSGVKRTVSKRELASPDRTAQKTRRTRVGSTEGSRTQEVRSTPRRTVRATTGTRTRTSGTSGKSTGKRVKKK